MAWGHLYLRSRSTQKPVIAACLQRSGEGINALVRTAEKGGKAIHVVSLVDLCFSDGLEVWFARLLEDAGRTGSLQQRSAQSSEHRIPA